MCDVCKSEMGLETSIVLLDDIIDDEEPLKLCPICKTNYIGMDEKMCDSCFNRSAQEEELNADNDDWRTYLDDDDADDVTDEGDIPLDELEEEFEEEEFEDEENPETELDDFDDFADISDLDDLDDEEDDDEDEDF